MGRCAIRTLSGLSDQKSSKFKIGSVVTLNAVRESELGVFLDAKTGNTSDDILLHKAQQTVPVKVGEDVTVFLYLDPKNRLAASMRVPKMRVGQVARVKVINTSKDGAFVDVGAERGIFMPFAGMRGKVRTGDMVWVKLYIDKSGRPAVTMEVEEELRRASRPAENIKVGDEVTGSVYNYTDQGGFLFTTDRNIAFLHVDEIPAARPKVGEEITARVTYIREDGRINVSLRPLKQEAIDVDAEKILALLEARNGKMPYSDETPPEIIKDKFNISKASFKRALGRLLKSGKIIQQEGWTYLNQKER